MPPKKKENSYESIESAYGREMADEIYGMWPEHFTEMIRDMQRLSRESIMGSYYDMIQEEDYSRKKTLEKAKKNALQVAKKRELKNIKKLEEQKKKEEEDSKPKTIFTKLNFNKHI